MVFGRLAAATLLAALFAGCQGDTTPVEMSGLKAFATDYAAAWSSRNPDALAANYAEDGVLQVNSGEPAVGRAAIAGKARSFMEAFPDMVVRLDRLELSGEHVNFHWHWTGTNTGPGGNGAAVDIRGYEQWTFNDDGLIVQSLGSYDEAEYERQLAAGGG